MAEVGNKERVRTISIPSGTIKSGFFGCIRCRLVEFQFLLVRLKGVRADFDYCKNYIFQFLLVRLKGLQPATYQFQVLISIPSGTIKSRPPPPIAVVIIISIPSGTIKRRRSEVIFFKLKISIPSGTIKRHCWDTNYHLLDRFQFLLVRLKV